MQFFADTVGHAIVLFARLVTAVRAIWDGVEPVPDKRVYFANHTSNGDFVLIWAVLPPKIRRRTRPVAGSDYWLKSKLKSFIGRDVFNAVLIDRNSDTRTNDPIAQMAEALDDGNSLILFPEGTRNMSEEPLLSFKTGLFHLAKQRPDVDLVPVWVENLNHVMPKGEILPIPLVCTVRFGEAVRLHTNESKDAFLQRSYAALVALKDTGDVA
ncbi:acyl-phosphate glycerol 3-phosphate acyltransferase [Ruegeria sp. ANG-R]|uniref:lysophospholipid acyltransferase family protein n=1 Tax=Ruegeria sp. ANG-R TaxID=1577903 RepID=UPI00057F64ED|nr:lysophospholipid acyltransferase family protein [Ruegeria sp. ANG-R]KIC36662.1 acyl-phosphate glycerol 3-phosphate acyltransferase [Ruegeria sp. ANG-R]